MAVKATVYKVELQVNDIDRHYYASHALTLALHPSETEERLMVRLLAYALNAGEGLAFGRGVSSDDEPDLWQRDLTGVIETWIDVGQPDEQRIRRACGRAREVRLYCYSGRSAAVWWQKNAAALGRCGNLRVFEVPADSSQQLARLATRNMALQCLVQDGQVQIMGDEATVTIDLVVLK